MVDVLPDCTGEDVVFWVPNTFTPDGDQHNQSFKPVFYSGYDPFEFVMYIFDRWGELVYETHNVKFGWDGSTGRSGRKAPDGVYTWKIVFKALNNDDKIMQMGHVTLIR
ncbi:MAG: gliding motility-associated C-terminal domain-containing protein [Synechococcaceae bacterium WB7_1C_051]|nr:gliding motility-associated C-terminal domain-containing protein [Synechococcaceae bacterium WB7_1C_051]